MQFSVKKFEKMSVRLSQELDFKPKTFKLFTGNANPELAAAIADRLKIPMGKCTVGKFSNGETNVTIHESGSIF